MKSSLPVFELQVLMIFAITQIWHFFLKRFDFPQFIPQMIAGLILGPAIRVDMLDKYKKMLFPYPSQDTLASITSIGYALFIFTSGVQMDLSMITRTGHRAWTIAILGMTVPLLICIPIITTIHFEDLQNQIGIPLYNVSPIVLSEVVISFAVVASLLSELKILNSELGRLALSSVLVSDILSKTISCVNNAFLDKEGHHNILVLLISLVAFGTFIPLIFRPAMFWIIKHTPEGRPVDDGYVYLIITMVFALGWIAVKINQEFILGAFILGLAVPEGPPLGSSLVKKLQFFGNSLLLPIFVTCGVMKADFSLHHSSKAVVVIGIIILVTHLIKLIACIIPALFCKIPLKDALALALILNVKGVVDVGAYGLLYDDGVISGHNYGIMIISIMITACIVKWSVKLLYDPSRKYAGYQKRNVMSLKSDSELRILACVHKPYHITATIDVLDLCCPTTEKPIIVDALHLIELIGRTSPIFISHRIQRTISSGSHQSYSDNVILAFDLYEHDNIGAVTAHAYTAISPPTLMHEDVCQLALDKVASIIILPFHRRWSIDGGIESDDKNIRALNCKVLDIAPCSVGILLSRSSIQRDSFIQVAMIYLGGKDDREALSIAKRTTRNSRVKLVVYHLAAKEHTPNIDYLLDHEALKDVKKPNPGTENVSYHKVIVDGGAETSAVLRHIVDEYDFFIVGRRHEIESTQTDGLAVWSEFSELGTIGDLLASSDFGSRAGVLVVQQQVKDT
ncbi:cation/H(+) antiporter 4 [Cajanus cajan]|uniref:K(+)/H(+) antiporter 13 n=1 Tax=Cajanus cajan TaxID=3821 RepID=A0A151TL65_CAJCA|nr:cation/H(+) antiporter 4 [Cajanus cajan]KYP67780.1 K(+)/H(+) antiporter 13 [Cajanus cajan]